MIFTLRIELLVSWSFKWSILKSSIVNSFCQSNMLIPFAGFPLGILGIPTFANFSAHLIRPVICITTNRVTMDPIVTARPVNPLKKNAYEKSTR